jgi:hypothetical protein
MMPSPPAPARPAPRPALLLAAAALLGLAGCSSLATKPQAGGVAIAGTWQLDAAHGDDFDARLDQWLELHRKKLREMRRRGAGGYSGEGGGEGGGMGQGMGDSRSPPALFMPPEDPARERQRVADELRPPAVLEIALEGDAIRISADADPPRRLVPGEKLTRMDTGGTAELACGWEGNAFVVRARYLHKAQREWRYERERQSGLLRVDFIDTDPDYGRLELHLRYRPAG